MKKQILLATNNIGKVKDFQIILGKDYDILTLNDLNLDIQIIEDGNTFEENSKKKSIEIFNITKIPCIADDSGLCIDYLDGYPGVHTKRFLGENTTQTERNANLLLKLKDCPYDKRTATFICALSYYDGLNLITVQGKLNGKISFERKGLNGFGFDEILIPNEYTKTLAELSLEEKNNISARKVAIKKLKVKLDNII